MLLNYYKQKKNLRVLKVRKFKNLTEQRSIFAGALIQDSNAKKSKIKTICGTYKLKKDQLNFFVNILKYIKSNAIALFDKDSLVSQSGGQTSRVDALQNCFYKLKQKHDYKKLKNLSLFSDAFFPFTDSLEFIKKEKINWCKNKNSVINTRAFNILVSTFFINTNIKVFYDNFSYKMCVKCASD